MLDDKMGILDIKAKIDNSVNCDIEMQIVDRRNIEKRILYYWSKMYSSSIKSGGKFRDLQKGIIILISDYELNSLQEIKKYITKWNIREEEYSKIILTDVIEFYILELPKFKKYHQNTSNTELDSWIKFIEELEVNDMNDTSENTKAIQKAKKVLEEISQDEHERYLAELREKYIMDQAAIEEAGYDKGFKAAIEQSNKKILSIAKKLKEQSIDIEIISKLTGLTIDEISQDEHEGYLAELREKYIMDQSAIEEAGYDKGVKQNTIIIAKKMKEENIDIKLINKITNLTIDEINNL